MVSVDYIWGWEGEHVVNEDVLAGVESEHGYGIWGGEYTQIKWVKSQQLKISSLSYLNRRSYNELFAQIFWQIVWQHMK